MVVRQGSVIHKKGMELWPLEKAAKDIGIAYQTLFKAIKSHKALEDCIEYHEKRRFARMPDMKHSYNKFIKVNASKKASSSGAVDRGSFYDANIKQKNLKSELLRLELEEKAGRMIPLELAQQAWRNIANSTMKALTTIPDRLAPLLVSQEDQTFIYEKIDAEIKQALRNLRWREPARVPKKK